MKKIFIIAAFILTGWALISYSPTQTEFVEAKIISSPDELPETLAHQKIIFYNVQEKTAQITTLDKKETSFLYLPGNDFSLSPNNKYLIYSAFDEIKIINLETTDEETLVSIQKDFPNSLRVNVPSFTRETTRVIFQVDITNTEFDLATIDINDKNIERLNVEGFNTRPKFSPNENFILTICEGKEAPGFNICLIDANTRKREHLTDIEAYHWAWFSPNGDKIVFTRLKTRFIGKNTAGLYTMDIDGTDETLLLNWYVSIMGFSEDGNSVIFRRAAEDDSYGGIYAINLDGKKLLHLAYFDDDFLTEWQ
ncbi:MAG: hypothetical protein HN975_01350 [Anaerolineae bacterium]|mgnify:FL=1|jgi:Tol biopolymer transport system component|nr:hypothetical protein [Anaerolineae bacterium]MBT7989989.1 hypothetical protein [Anaerolineae bacterium]